MRLWPLALLLAGACNTGDLVGIPRTSPVASPSPSSSPTPQPTVTPPCDGTVIGPPTIITTTTEYWSLAWRNYDWQIKWPKDYGDGDGDVFTYVDWCTAFPGDPSPPHEVRQTWEMSCCDGDFNQMVCPPVPGGSPCQNPELLPCCSP